MGLLGRIFGREPPDPPGTTYFVDGGALVGSAFRVKRVLPGQTVGDDDLKTVGPSFTSFMEAARYRDSLTGGPAYRYPDGAV